MYDNTKFILILLLILIIIVYYNILKIKKSKKYIEGFSDLKTEDFGFIITRHVNSEKTNLYWIESIKCIRKFYKNEKIVIIDDNSKQEFINNMDVPLDNCIIVNSEYPARGELLPYYYLYKNKYFKKAVIIHDSIFFTKYIDFTKYNTCKFLFHHTHEFDEDLQIIMLLKELNNPDRVIEEYKKKDKWFMCFGVQSVITLDFITQLHEKYNFFVLLNHIKTRDKRMCLERIFGLLTTLEDPDLLKSPSIFGLIGNYPNWSIYHFENYLEDKKNNNLNKREIVKVWTGR